MPSSSQLPQLLPIRVSDAARNRSCPETERSRPGRPARRTSSISPAANVVPTCPSTVTRSSSGPSSAHTRTAAVGGNTSGPDGERVRRDRREDDGVDRRLHDRAAGRQTVRRRARGRGEHDPVRAHRLRWPRRWTATPAAPRARTRLCATRHRSARTIGAARLRCGRSPAHRAPCAAPPDSRLGQSDRAHPPFRRRRSWSGIRAGPD